MQHLALYDPLDGHGGSAVMVTREAMTQADSWWAAGRLAGSLSVIAVLIATVALLIAPVRQYLASHTDIPTAVAIADSAPLGGHKLISLSDGSTVDLNSGSHLSAVMSAKERSTRLESGEAVFQVAADRKRPLTVKVDHVQIRVLGTRFDVYRGAISPLTSERSTRITVLDGAIQITRDDTSSQSIIHLAAGEQIEIPDDRTKVARLRHMSRPAAERLTAWQHGDIEFEDRPLKEILAEYARYQPIRFDITDQAILNQRFTGVFHTNDVSLLLKTLEIQCIRSSYKDAGQQLVLSRLPGKRVGDQCG